MVVWIVNQYAYTPREKAGTRHFAFARELRRRGHDVRIISSSFYHKGRKQLYAHEREPALHGDVEGVPYVWLRTPAYAGNLSRLWNMSVFAARLLRGRGLEELPRPDVIFSTSPSPFAAAAALVLARRLGCAHVLEVVDIWPDTLSEVSRMSRGHPLMVALRRLEEQLYGRTDAIVTHLGGAHRHFVERGADPERCNFIPSPLPFDAIPDWVEPPSDPPFRFIHAGAMTPSYALDQILDAADRLVARDPMVGERIAIDFIGEGPLRAALEGRVQASGHGGWIRFLGAVPKAEILHSLAAANAFLIVSKDLAVHRFGVSFNKIFDSMTVGRPIVLANRAPGTPIEAAGVGLILSPQAPDALADAMNEVSRWPAERVAAVGARAREHVLEHHSAALWGDRMEALLSRVTERK